MKLPNRFKNVIANTFYDKSLPIYSISTSYNDEGGVIEGKKTLIETLSCNVQIQNVEKIRQTYGEDIVAEVTVTCCNTIATEKNVAIYNDIEYEIVKIIPNDSHTTLLLHHDPQGVE